MAEGFHIADAYADVYARVRNKELERSATTAGDSAGRILGDRIVKGADGRLRDSRGRFVTSGTSIGGGLGDGIVRGADGRLRDSRGRFVTSGRKVSDSLGDGITQGISGFGRIFATALPASMSSPYVAVAVTAAGAALAPVFIAGFSAALIGGAGLGVIGLGALLLKEEPALIASATKLKDETVAVFKDAAKPMLEPLIGALEIFRGLLKDLTPDIKGIFKDIAPAIEPLAQGIADFIREAMPGFRELIKASGPFLKDMAPALGDLGKGFSEFLKGIAGSGDDASVFFKDLIGFLSWLLANSGTAIGKMTSMYTKIRSGILAISNGIKEAKDKIKGYINGFKGAIDTVTGWFSSIPGRISGGLNSAEATVRGWAQRITDWFKALPGRAGTALSSLPGTIGGIFTNAMDRGAYLVGYGIGSVIKLLKGLPGKAGSAVSGLWSALSGAFTTTKSNMGKWTSEGVATSIRFLKGLPSKARSAVSGLWSAMVGAFNAAKSGASNSASDLVAGTIRVLKGLPGKARSAVSGTKNAIVGAFAGAGSWLYQAGRDILAGLAGGIRSAVGAAVQAAKDAVGSVIKGAKDALGISSPSKVFQSEIGKWLLPGMTRGMWITVPRARREVSGIMRRVTPPSVGYTPSPTWRGVDGLNRPNTGAWGRESHVINVGSITLDASGMKSIQDVVDLISGLQSGARSYRARVATAPGR